MNQAKDLPPTATIKGGDRSVAAGTSVTLDGSESNDPEGALSSLVWDFGDGGKSSEALATHTYSVPGAFTVTLTATDKAGQTAVAQVKITVSGRAGNKPPNPTLTGDVQLSPGAIGKYDASGSTDPDGTIKSYTWSFGDSSTATGAKVTHVWTAPGTYSVAVIVADDLDATATANLTVNVLAGGNQPPHADAGADRVAAPGQQVSFDGSNSSDPDGTIVGYLWEFGDGTTATTAKATKTFNAVNKFNVKLTVTDDKGATGSATVVIDVKSASYDGTYTVVANPKTGSCLSNGDSTWVDTQLKITVTGSVIKGSEIGAPVAVNYTGTISGSSFTMNAKYNDGQSGDHDDTYTGTFSSATTFTGTLKDKISTSGLTLCTLTWNVTASR